MTDTNPYHAFENKRQNTQQAEKEQGQFICNDIPLVFEGAGFKKCIGSV